MEGTIEYTSEGVFLSNIKFCNGTNTKIGLVWGEMSENT